MSKAKETTEFAGWSHKLWRICSNDEKRAARSCSKPEETTPIIWREYVLINIKKFHHINADIKCQCHLSKNFQYTMWYFCMDMNVHFV